MLSARLTNLETLQSSELQSHRGGAQTSRNGYMTPLGYDFLQRIVEYDVNPDPNIHLDTNVIFTYAMPRSDTLNKNIIDKKE